MSDLPLYILVLLLLVPLSGFIAWAGDRIGHRIGKRRQSFLGLRPRHTATVFTIGAGIGIALVSFGLLLLSDARLNHRCRISSGILAERCGAILTEFFAAKRRLGKK